MVISAHRALRVASAAADQYRRDVSARDEGPLSPVARVGAADRDAGGGTDTAFQGARRRLNCTLLARWEEGYRDPWLLLTDLAPRAGTACW